MIREAGQLAICQLVLLWVKQLMRVLWTGFWFQDDRVAVSDPLALRPRDLRQSPGRMRNKLRRTCARIEELIREYQIETIVLGYPKNME